MTNLERAFSHDLTVLLIAALILAPVYVGARYLLAPEPRRRVVVPAVLELVIAGSTAGVVLVTLTATGMPDGAPVDWRPLSSDLASGSQRAQAIGNLVLFMPLLAATAWRYLPTVSARQLLIAAVVLPLAVELGQLVLENGRAVTVEDWLLGSAGAAVGVLLGQRASTATR